MSAIFTIYFSISEAARLDKEGLRQYWRDAVNEQGGTPVAGCSITIREFGSRVAVSGAAERP